jgi:hypothetical protein
MQREYGTRSLDINGQDWPKRAHDVNGGIRQAAELPVMGQKRVISSTASKDLRKSALSS